MRAVDAEAPKPWIDQIVPAHVAIDSRWRNLPAAQSGRRRRQRAWRLCDESADATRFSDALLAGNFRDDRHPFARIRPPRGHGAARGVARGLDAADAWIERRLPQLLGDR
jgi:hypothetical protein